MKADGSIKTAGDASVDTCGEASMVTPLDVVAEYLKPLEVCDPTTDDALPSDVTLKKLTRILDHDGQHQFLLLPGPNRTIHVYGDNVDYLKDACSALLLQEEFTLITHCTDDPSSRHLKFTVEKFLPQTGGWKMEGTATCELMVKVVGMERDVVYCVVPAHLVLSNDQCKQLERSSKDLDEIRSLVENQKSESRYLFKDDRYLQTFFLRPSPLLGYRHWIKKPRPDGALRLSSGEAINSKLFMNDIAFLKFQPDNVSSLTPKVKLFDIPSGAHLDTLSKKYQRVFVGSFVGRLVPNLQTATDSQFGFHLSFVLTSTDDCGQTQTLSSGDSGLVVHFKGKDDKLIPVGMLVGKFETDPVIYQAIVLSQSLKDIASDYAHVIRDIELLEVCHASTALITGPKEDQTVEQQTDLAEACETAVAMGTIGMHDHRQLPQQKEQQISRLENTVQEQTTWIMDNPKLLRWMGIRAGRHSMFGPGIWYRHSGEDDVDLLPLQYEFRFKPVNNEQDILADMGDNVITHMVIHNTEVPQLDVVAPRLQSFMIRDSENIAQLSSMSPLVQLKELILWNNDFSAGLPPVVSTLTSLEKLGLSWCRLKNLPSSMKHLTLLRELDLHGNQFKTLPPVACQLAELRSLNLDGNESLDTLHPNITFLTRLTKLSTDCCFALKTPSYDICHQGLPAIKQYYRGRELSHGDMSSTQLSFTEVSSKLRNKSLQPTSTSDDIKSLFHISDLVYEMTSPRGVALVINNSKFNSDLRNLVPRHGSELDVTNVETMLRRFDFRVLVKRELTGQDMLSAIERVAMEEEWKDLDDYGMFVLVLMSHGDENDHVYGTDGKVIHLKDVYKMLSSLNFPAMSGKPKLVIVQACGGELKDFGDKGRDIPDASLQEHLRKLSLMTIHPRTGTEIIHLNTDDLIIIKASVNTYLSMRSPKDGSVFISLLVYNFYKHACHHDVETLCKLVQQEVKEHSIKLGKDDPETCLGQTPVYFSTLTKLRKLYLFPGYNGK